MSELVPEGWKSENLGDIAGFSGGSAFKEIYQGQRTGTHPFIKVSDMNLTGNERYITKSTNWVSESVRKKAKIKLFSSNSTVFAKVGAALLLNRRRQLVRETAIDNNMMAAIPYNCDPHFLYYFMQSLDLMTIVQSGAVPSVNQSQMESIPVNTPPIVEQKKISSILTSVDEVIEKTQLQINKLQDLKKGTMNKLLTKGIGHTEFKDSELGRIPKSWRVVSFQEVFESYTYGPRFSSKDYSLKGNVKTIRGTDLTNNWSINYKQVPLAALDEKVVSHHRLKENDVIMITTADCGFSAVFEEQDIPFIASAYAIRLRPTSKIDSRFCVWYLHTPSAKVQIEKYERKGTVSNLPGSDVMKVKLPLPSINEQSDIARVMHSIDKNISIKKDKLAQTQSLKKSLMQDLLTGKVRVTVN